MYDGVANEGMRGIRTLLYLQSKLTAARVRWEVFDVRKAGEVPGMDYHIYISSGGPGSPLPGKQAWERTYLNWIDKLWNYNVKYPGETKHAFFICHSFQVLCRHLKIANVCKRHSTAFGIFPVHETEAGKSEPLFSALPDPFYVVDSRDYQVIEADEALMRKNNYSLLAIEKDRPHVPYERAVMAVRFSDCIAGTQFHPEADAEGMLRYFSRKEKKEHVVKHHGERKYYEMVESLDDPDKILLTQKTIIPAFLGHAFGTILETADCL
jgi:GMP synthase-like glutamine amidotransferase